MIQILNYDKIRCDKITRDEIFARAEEQTNVADVVSEIIKTVREEGDSALFVYCEKFDKAVLDSLEVPQSEIDQPSRKWMRPLSRCFPKRRKTSHSSTPARCATALLSTKQTAW